MNKRVKETVIDCLNQLELIKDDLAFCANLTANLAEQKDGEQRGKLTAEAVALFTLVNSTAKSLAVFQAHTRHFKRHEIIVEVVA